MEETAKLHENLVQLNQEGKRLFKGCFYADAYEKYAEAECLLDPDDPSTQIDQSIAGAAQCLNQLKRFGDANDAYNRLLQRVQSRNDKLGEASIRINMAACLSSLGQYERGLRECCTAFLLAQSVVYHSDKWLLTMQATVTSAVSSVKQMRNTQSFTAQSRMLMTETTTKLVDLLSSDDVSTTAPLFQQGILFLYEVAMFLQHNHSHDKDIPLLVSILNIQNVRDKEVLSTAKLLYQIAYCYYCKGNSLEAKKYLQNCIEVRKAKPDPDGYQKQEIAECRSRLALCHYSTNNYEDSARCAWAAMTSALARGHLYHTIISTALEILLKVMVKMNQY